MAIPSPDTRDTNEQRGSFSRFLLVAAIVALVLFGLAFGLMYALWATRSPDYSGPEKLKTPDRPTVGF